MEFTAAQLAGILKADIQGDKNVKVRNFARIEKGKAGDICFFANPKYEKYVYSCKASILLVSKDFQPKENIEITLLRVEDPYKALAKLLEFAKEKASIKRNKLNRIQLFLKFPKSKFGKHASIAPTAVIGRGTSIGENTVIDEQVYVGSSVKIGKNCIIYPGVRIMEKSVIGDNVIIQANAVIGSDGFGNVQNADGSWEKIEHIGNVIIEDNVEIGANTTIDRSEFESTIIRKGARIDNLCQIAHNVEVGENTAMAALCGIAGSTKIGKNCILAGQVGVTGHITIADGTIILAQAGVSGNIRKSGMYLGSPAIDSKNYLRSYVLFKQAGESK